MSKKLKLFINIGTILAFFVSCLSMFSFYKMLSGFVANSFGYPLLMAPMVFTYLLIPCMVIAFFYDTYIARIKRNTRLGMVSVFGILSILSLIGTFVSIDIYISNLNLGVYSSMPTVGFPVDGILINVVVLALVALGLIATLKPEGKLGKIHEKINLCGTVEISKRKFLALLPLTIFALAFVGDGIMGFTAIENALYDPRFIYIMIFVGLLPILNLIIILLKPERLATSNGGKIGILAGGVSINVIFLALLLAFELSTPDFMVHIGKVFLIITFSVSFPVEVLVVVATIVTGTVVMVLRLINLVKERKNGTI